MNAVKQRVEPPPVAEQIHDLDDNVLICRDLRHAWLSEISYHAVAVEGGQRGARYLERTLACMRCDTKKTQLVRIHDSWIEIIGSPRYVYAKGYQIKGATRADHVQGMVRLEQMTRGMEGR